MWRSLALVALIAVPGVVAIPSRALASSRPAQPAAAVATFRLDATGQVSGNLTFWVAYGPLGGHFGLIRLKPAGHNSYTASRRLPTGRTTYAYIVGHGTQRTKMGLVPGNPVQTIRVVGPTSIWPNSPRPVRWTPPVG